MSLTIKDVAKEAGVSIATVSKVINGKPSISEPTRLRVLEVIQKLNYHPNAQASNFARERSDNIIFLAVIEPLTAFHNPHMFEIMCGAQKVVYEKKYNFSFLGVHDKDTACHEVSNIIGRRAADGILIHGSSTSRSLVDLLVKKGFPHVIIGRPPFSTTACWIDINNHVSGHLATESDEISRHRLRGFVSSMRIFGLDVPESSIKYGTYSKQSGFEMMEELLRGSFLPDAVICEDNKIAMGAASAIRKHGMNVPDDIGLITFDDYPLSQLIDPPLTVVDINVNKMGQQAAEILMKKIRNPSLNMQSFTTVPELIVRSSTRNINNTTIL